MVFIALLLSILSTQAGLAWEPEFGSEPTVQAPEMAIAKKHDGWLARLVGIDGMRKLITEDSRRARIRYLEILKETCRKEKCVLSIEKDSHFPSLLKYFGYNGIRITYPNGFWLQVSYDVAVLEFQTPKAPLRVYEANRDILQRDLFDTAKAAGLRPSIRGQGGGHISYDRASSFEGDRLFARNMLVDEANNTFLGEGVIGPRGFSPGIGVLPEPLQDAFRDALKGFDANPDLTIDNLYDSVRKNVYVGSIDPNISKMAARKAHKYQAIALWEKRIEDRRFAPPTSADDLIAQLRLKRARLNYVRKIRLPIPYAPIVGDSASKPALWRRYLREMNEDPRNFRGRYLLHFDPNAPLFFIN